MFRLCNLCSHLNVLTFFPLTGGCSEGLNTFRCFVKYIIRSKSYKTEEYLSTTVMVVLVRSNFVSSSAKHPLEKKYTDVLLLAVLN